MYIPILGSRNVHYYPVFSSLTGVHGVVPCSAGGIGVLLHIDYLKRQLAAAGATEVYVQGLVDSAWYAHNPANCTPGLSEEGKRKHCLDANSLQLMKDGHQ